MFKKGKEVCTIFARAIQYSFRFCWRNGKADSFWRIFVAIGTSISGYLVIYATSALVSAVHHAIKTHTVIDSWSDFSGSGLFAPTRLLVGAAVWSAALQKLYSFFRQRSSESLHFANEREVQQHKATLDVAKFRSKEYDDLVSRIDSIPWGWKSRIFFAEEIVTILTTFISFVLFGTALVYTQAWYAVVLGVSALPMIAVEFWIVGLWWKLSEEMVPHHKNQWVNTRVYKQKLAFAQALMFNQFKTLRKEIDLSYNHITEKNNELRWISFRWGLVTEVIAITGLVSVILHAVWNTVAIGNEAGALVLLISAARTFQGDLGSIISSIADQWNSAKGVLLIEEEFFRTQPIIKTEFPVVPEWNSPPPIEVRNMSFTYPNTDKVVLKNVSFTLLPGSRVAIVGRSGSGKSTLQALLARIHDPSSGDIIAGGVNLRNIPPEHWRNVLSSLTQEYMVLERPIGREIASSRLGDPEDRARVMRAAEFACFTEVIASDPLGFNTQIGTEYGGREFSGGEKQRLALARVIYHGTPILILDEPDAKLDPESAERVMENIRKLTGITLILITHHVSRTDEYDQVIVMEKGEVVETGTPTELLARNGVYASMHEKDKERLGSHVHKDSDSDEESV